MHFLKVALVLWGYHISLHLVYNSCCSVWFLYYFSPHSGNGNRERNCVHFPCPLMLTHLGQVVATHLGFMRTERFTCIAKLQEFCYAPLLTKTAAAAASVWGHRHSGIMGNSRALPTFLEHLMRRGYWRIQFSCQARASTVIVKVKSTQHIQVPIGLSLQYHQ